jgi:hypothetical protein
MGRRANIRSPDVLKRFRYRFVEFDDAARIALDTVRSDVTSVEMWLKTEQLRYWNLQLRRRHDEMKQAWREYVNARYGDRRTGKPSCIDERKAWERAKRRREEAEQKIRLVKSWAATLDREAELLLPRCQRFEEILCRLSPKALARLDHMLDNLEKYLRPLPPKSRSAPKPE